MLRAVDRDNLALKARPAARALLVAGHDEHSLAVWDFVGGESLENDHRANKLAQAAFRSKRH